MFHSARIKLTAWYVGIIMLISMLFSLVIFAGINNEFSRFERVQRIRIEREQYGLSLPKFPRREVYFDPEVLSESRNRIIFVLLLINLGILAVSAGAAYFLAGRTMEPIRKMVDEQNRFIADASHELRTPLTALKTSVEVAIRNDKLGLSQAKKTLSESLTDINDLKDLSDNLLLLTQHQNTTGNGVFEKIKLAQVLNLAIKKTAHIMKLKHIQLKTDVGQYLIRGNRQNLVELLVIFIDNAVKYSPKNSSVQISAGKTDGKISIRIQDFGEGIQEKDMPFIFDRFFRADASRSKSSAPGFGLGLSIAKRIINLHNGTVEVTSKKHKGSVFTITLPSA